MALDLPTMLSLFGFQDNAACKLLYNMLQTIYMLRHKVNYVPLRVRCESSTELKAALHKILAYIFR